MKQRTINHLLAVICMLLLGVGSSYAQWLNVAAGTTLDDRNTSTKYTTNTSNITLPNQGAIGNKSAGTISYDSNANKLTFNNVHRTSATSSSTFFNYAGRLTVELIGDNELDVELSGVDLRFFWDDIIIVGSGSLNLVLSKDNGAIRTVNNIDMRGTGVVDIELKKTNTHLSYNYPAASVDIQEGMMVLRDIYKPTNLSDENMLSHVYTEDGGLHYTHYWDQVGDIWLRIEPLKKFNLYVAGQQANWINRADILGDGHVSYNLTENQLRLKDADINYEFNGGDDKTSIIQYSAADVANEHISGVELSTFKVMLEGNNTITGVANASLATFHGFMQNCTFLGSGNLQMNMSAKVAVSSGVFAFGYRYGTTEAVTLDPSFTGWVSASCSNVGNNPASVFERANDELRLPSTDGFFITKGSTLPTVAQTPATTNTNMNVAHVNFGKADGSPQATVRLINSDTFLGTNYVGKELSATTGCALQAMGGQAPFYYTAANLPGGLSINPETGVISGTYTTPNSLPNPQGTLTATDLQGRQSSMSINQPWVYGKMTTDNSSLTGLQWTRNVAIPSINLSSLITNGAGQYTFTVLAPNPVLGNTRLPAGVLLSSDGVISGTPTGGGNFQTAIQVTDAIGQVAGFVLDGHIDANYDFHVAGTLVTSSNMNDILGTSGNQGVCSYDHANKTLVLNNFHYDGSCSTFIDDTNGAVETIRVIGENSINMTGSQDYSYLIQHDINVTGSINGSVLPKLQCEVDHEQYHRMYGVKGNVTVIDDVILEIFAPSGAILGTLNVPANQIIHTGNQKDKSDAVAHNETSYKINNPMVFTTRLENGALRFANEKDDKVIFNTVPVKPFTMFDVEGGVAPYTYSATSLPSGLSFDTATGTISGTSAYDNSNTTVTFTVTDKMGREVSTNMELVAKNPTLTVKDCGGTTERTGTVRKWSLAVSTASMLQEGQLALVEADFDGEEVVLDIPNNMVVRDVNGKTYANNITLKDGVKYAFPYEVDANSISYTRTFTSTQASTWQALYVPFDITVTEELLKDFSFAKLYMMSYKDTNENGEIEDGEPLVMLLSRQHAGKVLHANTPYFISAKTAGTKSIEVESSTLKPAENGTVYCCTTEHEYTLTGIYEPTYMQGKYGMSNQGNFIYITSSTTKLNPNRWYLEIYGLSGEETESVAESRQILIMVDGEDDTNGIMDITSHKASSTGGIFTLDGRKLNDTEKLPHGIYIINGKKVIVK